MGRFLQWNVFEDGLCEAPGTIGFSPAFRQALDTLLRHLAWGGTPVHTLAGEGEGGAGVGTTRDGVAGVAKTKTKTEPAATTAAPAAACSSATAATVGEGGEAGPYLGFATSRTFDTLPAVVPLDSTARLFDHIDVVYCSVYHHLGYVSMHRRGMASTSHCPLLTPSPPRSH